MVELTIDGHKVEVPEGSMVMHAVEKLAQYVPHFCYHKKLSIAANCRMCLVEVEKAPKPMPACATPVSPGMIVHTASEKAKNAQKGVMEFLLINHPLDCPICDQGGECQLQDLAVGYGASESKYEEEKRVVFHKSLGPLVSAEEMTRCIHCTRCVRFGQEVAGIMELGMVNRGEHAEITSFLGHSVDSELSGNMIDICPVGALTSKPFRYSARTWELARRKSISPHDGVGTNITVQVKNNKVMRVVALENEAVNECWISDRDRFSYEGLNSEDRLAQPMIKVSGQWQATDWPTALSTAVEGLNRVRAKYGASGIGGLFSATSTLEETYLLKQLINAYGSDQIDFRLRLRDAGIDNGSAGAPWLGLPIADVNSLDRMLIVGSFLRKDQPLLASRIRQAVKRGAKVSLVHAADDDLLMPIAAKCIVKPSQMPRVLAEIAVAVAREKGVSAPDAFAGIEPAECASMAAKSLAGGKKIAVLLGSLAINHADASSIQATCQWIAATLGGTQGRFAEYGNTTGAYILGAYSQQGFKGAAKGVIAMNLEPALDCGDAGAALAGAEFVLGLTSFASAMASVADVMLPIAPFTETSGSFISMEGRLQTFTAAVKPLADTRPGWKVLRVLGTQAGFQGFEFDTSDAVRSAAIGDDSQIAARLSNISDRPLKPPASSGAALERVADVPVYFSDAIVRQAPALQKTSDARTPTARVNARTLNALGLEDNAQVRVLAASGCADLKVKTDNTLPDGTVRIAAAHATTAALGDAETLTLERLG